MSSESKPNLFVVSSPSGGGKSTLVQAALQRVPGLAFSVSFTTRQPRPNERQDREYHFVSEEEFLGLRDRGQLLEWAEVHGNFYGTSKEQVDGSLSQGVDLILDIDVQGARQIHRAEAGAILVFVMPPSAETLRQRLINRSTDPSYNIERRLQNAYGEVRAWNEFDYIIVNDDLDRAVSSLVAIILAARQRTPRQSPAVNAILKTFGE